jgi:hypothetical protein
VINRLEDFRTKASALFEHLVDQSTISRSVRGQRGEMGLGIEQLEKNELMVAQGCVVLGHRVNS